MTQNKSYNDVVYSNMIRIGKTAIAEASIEQALNEGRDVVIYSHANGFEHRGPSHAKDITPRKENGLKLFGRSKIW